MQEIDSPSRRVRRPLRILFGTVLALTPLVVAAPKVSADLVAPVISTTASASVAVGVSFHDTAHLSGGASPTGTITFSLFGPNNAACTGAPILTSIKTVTGNSDYASDPFTPSAAGTYRFVAAYSGDGSNAPAGPTACSDASESVVVTKSAPAFATTVSASVPAGGAITDTDTLSGGSSLALLSGTITFSLFGPDTPPARARRSSPRRSRWMAAAATLPVLSPPPLPERTGSWRYTAETPTTSR